MNYVFDNSPLSVLFKNYYRRRFPTLWAQFDDLVNSGRLVSTREVFREIQDAPIATLRDWAEQNRPLFPTPTASEGAFIGKIFRVSHFQQNIEQKKILKGGKVADPFVIGRAAVQNATVVTMEELSPHAVRIPNICNHFGIPCVTLEGFMEAEGWEF